MPRIAKAELFRLLGYEPHAGQQLVHASRASRRVVACGARFGKSVLGAMEAVAALLEPGEQRLGWVVAPTMDLTDRVFVRVADAFQSHFQHRVRVLSYRERRIVVTNLGGGRSELRGMSADHPVGLLGESLDFLVADEAARLRDDVWEAHLAPRLIDRGGWALLLSTPAGPGWFFEAYRLATEGDDPAYEAWRLPSWTNPHVNRERIEAERGRLGPEVFEEQYEALFRGVDELPCRACGAPDPLAAPVVVVEGDEELRLCVACGGALHANGRTAVPLRNGKRGSVVVLRLELAPVEAPASMP